MFSIVVYVGRFGGSDTARSPLSKPAPQLDGGERFNQIDNLVIVLQVLRTDCSFILLYTISKYILYIRLRVGIDKLILILKLHPSRIISATSNLLYVEISASVCVVYHICSCSMEIKFSICHDITA